LRLRIGAPARLLAVALQVVEQYSRSRPLLVYHSSRGIRSPHKSQMPIGARFSLSGLSGSSVARPQPDFCLFIFVEILVIASNGVVYTAFGARQHVSLYGLKKCWATMKRKRDGNWRNGWGTIRIGRR